MSSRLTASGQRAVAESFSTVTTSVAHAVRPSTHNAAAGSHPTYRRPGSPGASRRGAVSIVNARRPPGNAGGDESGTRGTLEPHGSSSRTVALEAAWTLRGMPSPRGSARLPAGVKLVVSIHAARPAGGRNCGAMRAVKTNRLESGPAVAAKRNCATVSSGSGSHAIHAPFGRTGIDCPLMPRWTGPRAPRTAPNRNAESCDWMTSVAAG